MGSEMCIRDSPKGKGDKIFGIQCFKKKVRYPRNMKRKLTLFLIIWFLVLAGLVFWIWKRNIIGKGKLELEILAPELVEAGEEIEYTIRYKNNGSTTLEDAKLIFQFPEHSVVSGGGSLRMTRELENIYPGREISIKFKARLFGKEEDTKTAKAILSYRPKGLKSVYDAETSHTARISRVPLNFDFEIPSRMEPGRENSFSVNYFSNASFPFFDLAIRMEYPSGFQFLSSNPEALDQTEWMIGLLNKAEGGRVEVSGILSGEVGQKKVFKAQIGIWQGDQFVVLEEIYEEVDIMKPRISVFQQINGSPDYIASLGDILHYEVFFRNIGEEPFEDMFLIVTLDGFLYDFSSVRTIDGRFNKADNSIVWDWRDVPKLDFLSPGEEARVEFWIDVKNETQVQAVSEINPLLKDTVRISQVKEVFKTKLSSSLVVSQKVFFQDEVFGNKASPRQVAEI